MFQYIFGLQTLQGENGLPLPRGPLFMSPLSFTPAVMEAITDPSSTKSATLRQLLDLFDRKQVQLTSVKLVNTLDKLENLFQPIWLRSIAYARCSDLRCSFMVDRAEIHQL